MDKIIEGFKCEKSIIVPDSIRNYQGVNPITKHLHVTRIGYYPKAKYHYLERLKGCDENILIYCKEGNGWVNHNDVTHQLSRNQAFIIPADETHAFGADNTNPWSIYWIYFCGEIADMLFAGIIGKPILLKDSDKSRFDDRLQLFDEMYQNLEMGYSPENLEYVSFCLMHFLASLKYINQFREIKKARQTDVIQKSILFMKENLETKITLQEIANEAGYSVSHFCAYFVKKTSFAPFAYYHQLKIQRACSYLQFSDMKIKEIAFRLGYSDPYHFSNAFKKAMGTSPREYRKQST